MNKHLVFALLLVIALVGMSIPASGASPKTMIGINVVLNTDITEAILADLAMHGTVRDVVYEIRAVTLQARSGELDAVRSLPYVAAANPDVERTGSPIDTVAAGSFTNGFSMWNLDAVNVSNPGPANRTVEQDGSETYIAVLDTGLIDSWRQYFPQERIAEEYARSFGGGAGLAGTVSSQPNKWEHDQSSHGTHVTSTILGFSFFGTPFNGVAPMATVIPVKVLNQNGRGWSSVISRGIVYVANLKAGPLSGSPVIINMSLSGSVLDAMEKSAVDYAIENGVIVVAAAGNRGARGMGYPGAYEPVISVAASGWIGEWTSSAWWWGVDVPDPTDSADFYITDFSSRALAGQDLDVAAPGSYVVGPYQTNSGQISYYFLSGTSMSSPHVAGIVALMAQKYPALTAAEAESILEATAIPIAPGSRTIVSSTGVGYTVTWDASATGAGLVAADAALAALP